MILMNTIFYRIFNNCSSTNFVRITTFCYKNVIL